MPETAQLRLQLDSAFAERRLKYRWVPRNIMIVMKKRSIRLSFLAVLAAMPFLLLFLARRSLSGFEGLRPGDQLPEARLQQLGGGEIETGSWKGNPTLLVVLNPDCRACQLEMQDIASASAVFPEVRIALLSTRLHPLGPETRLPAYVDREGDFLARVRKLVTPASYWIDGSGTVRETRVGRRGSREVEKLLRRMLDLEMRSNTADEHRQHSPQFTEMKKKG